MKMTTRITLGLAAAALCALPLATVNAEDKKVEGPLSFTVKDIDGNDVALSKYAGKVVLIVNVASKCGLTPQYEQLEALNDKYKEQGLAVLGFPANDFMKQEPGTNEEIKFFCTSKYDVSFDMFSKVSVKGDDKAPLYKYLTEEEADEKLNGDIQWNFEKFLVGRDGKVAARFSPKTKPDSPEVIEAIEKALAAPAPAPAS